MKTAFANPNKPFCKLNNIKSCISTTGSINSNNHCYKLLFILTLYLFTFSLATAQVSDPRAKELAMDFFKVHDIKGGTEAIEQKYHSVPGSINPVSVFQNDKGGFVLISQTGNNYNIVGYSLSGSFIPGDIPDALLNLISIYEESGYTLKKRQTVQQRLTWWWHPCSMHRG
ncbi:MAG: Spi family protease inhibitor [Bacteroidales bacterium]|nr:Spi family protease inhibitor [Bacteroidales bacterium]